jgi:hypothetical protein
MLFVLRLLSRRRVLAIFEKFEFLRVLFFFSNPKQ